MNVSSSKKKNIKNNFLKYRFINLKNKNIFTMQLKKPQEFLFNK